MVKLDDIFFFFSGSCTGGSLANTFQVLSVWMGRLPLCLFQHLEHPVPVSSWWRAIHSFFFFTSASYGTSQWCIVSILGQGSLQRAIFMSKMTSPRGNSLIVSSMHSEKRSHLILINSTTLIILYSMTEFDNKYYIIVVIIRWTKKKC